MLNLAEAAPAWADVGEERLRQHRRVHQDAERNPRVCRSSIPCRARSAGRREPSRAGISLSIGPSTCPISRMRAS
jgi:hypothetical protein